MGLASSQDKKQLQRKIVCVFPRKQNCTEITILSTMIATIKQNRTEQNRKSTTVISDPTSGEYSKVQCDLETVAHHFPQAASFTKAEIKMCSKTHVNPVRWEQSNS